MSSVQVLSVLGATGSIGRSTLEVVALHPERFRVFALSGVTQLDLLAEQCARFRPNFAVVLDDAAAILLREMLSQRGVSTEVLVGTQALCDVAQAAEVTTVMAAIVGAAGLASTMAAAHAGKKILLANKESLVMAGSLLTEAVRVGGASLLPIDSEHNALFQCFSEHGVDSVTLTASGGPFLHTPLEQLHCVTPEQACAHPRWSMGRKISVDSATMMNKGLEVIEAHWLFDVPAEKIKVVIHPQSIVHSLVNYLDGSSLAQLGHSDMRVPIAHALAYPERITSGVDLIDLAAQGALEFYPPDLNKFTCLSLAFEALRLGGAAPIILNAANECAVAAFLAGEIGFLDIAHINQSVLSDLFLSEPSNIEEVMAIDEQTRLWAKKLCMKQVHGNNGRG